MESSFDIFDSAIRQALKNYWNNSNYDDMYQECYMKILEVLQNNTYDPVYNLYGYAYTIARNTISSFMYHHDKITTLKEDDLPEVMQPASGASLYDSNIYVDEAITKVYRKFINVLPEDFTKDDLYNLLYLHDPDTTVLTVVKGELIWALCDKGENTRRK